MHREKHLSLVRQGDIRSLPQEPTEGEIGQEPVDEGWFGESAQKAILLGVLAALIGIAIVGSI